MEAKERENLIYSKGKDNPIEKEEKIMISLLPDADKKKLLDIGCGVGTISKELQKKGFDVIGIDFSDVGVKKAKKKGVKAKVCDVDKKGLPFDKNSFGVVWAGDVIEHVFDPINLFREITRVMKPKGNVLVTVPNDFNLLMRLYVLITGNTPQYLTYKNLEQCKHHTMFSWKLLKYMLKKGKLKVEKFRSIVRVPFTKIEFSTRLKIVGILFGRIFIVKAGYLR